MMFGNLEYDKNQSLTKHKTSSLKKCDISHSCNVIVIIKTIRGWVLLCCRNQKLRTKKYKF